MNKMKAFFAVAALLLVGVGVFAGKSKYFDTYTVFQEYDPGGGAGIQYVAFTSALPSNTTLAQSGSSAQFNATSVGGFTITLWYYDITNPVSVPQRAVYPTK